MKLYELIALEKQASGFNKDDLIEAMNTFKAELKLRFEE